MKITDRKLFIILNILVLILVSIDLYVDLGIKKELLKNGSSEEISTKSILSIIPEKELDSIVKDLTDNTNSLDYTRVYDIFSDWTKNQISEQETQDTVDKIDNLTGKVIKFYYSYNEYQGFSEGADWYTVYFKSDFDKGAGTIKLNFRIIDGKNEITGFKYNIDDIK